MEHEYFIDRISAYYDKELKNEEEILVAEHLKDCPECQKVYDELAKLDQIVSKHSSLADTDYWEKSAQKIEKLIAGQQKTEIIEVKRNEWFGMSWKISSFVAAAAVIVLIAVNYDKINNVKPKSINDDQFSAIDDSTSASQNKTLDIPSEQSAPSAADVSQYAKLDDAAESRDIDQVKEERPSLDEPIAANKEAELASRTVTDQAEGAKEGFNSFGFGETDTSLKQPSAESPKRTMLKSTQSADVTTKPELSAYQFDRMTIDQLIDFRDSILNGSPDSNKLEKIEMNKLSADKMQSINTQTALLECNYYIALKTDNDTDYQKAYQHILNRSKSDDEKIQKLALNYLEKLKNK